MFPVVDCYSVDFNWTELVVKTTQVSSKRPGLTAQSYLEAADQIDCYEGTALKFNFTTDHS